MKNRPSLTEHIQMAQALQRAQADILTVVMQTDKSYPSTGSAETNPHVAAHKILHQIDQLRCLLDSRSYQELPADLWDPVLYYGANTELHDAYITRITTPTS